MQHNVNQIEHGESDRRLDDEEYINAAQRRLAAYALRYTAPPSLVTGVLFAAVSFVLFERHIESISWYGLNSTSVIELYIPSAFTMPLIQGPIILRRTLAARVAGGIPPPLVSLERVPWLRWGIGLGLVSGGVWASTVLGLASVLALWMPSATFGWWYGLAFKLLFTILVALSVAVLCAIASVRIQPKPVPDPGSSGPRPYDFGPRERVRGRLEVPSGRHERLNWNRWRVGVAPDVLQRAENAVFFSGAQQLAFLRRFIILLTLSVLMVVLGLHAGSMAVVVAAMLIAPLMTPITGLTLALVRGRPQRQIETITLTAFATGYIFVVAWLASAILPRPAVVNAVTLDFSDPRLSDMLIALLAGAVGVYVLVHTEASTALPGVAIGISLEPPIATAGIMMGTGRHDLVIGAFLMYLVNLAAIVSAGALVLILSGFLPITEFGSLPRRIRMGLLIAALSVAVLAFPLYRISSSIWEESEATMQVGHVVEDWTSGTDLELLAVDVDGSSIAIELTGTMRPPSVNDLVSELTDVLGRDVSVTVRVYPYSLYEAETDP